MNYFIYKNIIIFTMNFESTDTGFDDYSYVSYVNSEIKYSDSIFFENIVDNIEEYDELTIDDIIENIPKTINEKYDLNIIYDRILNKWKVGYFYRSKFLHVIFDYDLHTALIKLNNEIKDEENK